MCSYDIDTLGNLTIHSSSIEARVLIAVDAWFGSMYVAISSETLWGCTGYGTTIVAQTIQSLCVWSMDS